VPRRVSKRMRVFILVVLVVSNEGRPTLNKQNGVSELGHKACLRVVENMKSHAVDKCVSAVKYMTTGDKIEEQLKFSKQFGCPAETTPYYKKEEWEAMKTLSDPCKEVIAAEEAACTIAKETCKGSPPQIPFDLIVLLVLLVLVICCCCGCCYKKKKLCFKPKAGKVVAAPPS